MLRFDKLRLTKLRRRQVRLLAEVRFLERFMKGDSVSSYYADKMLDAIGELAVIEHEITLLEGKYVST